MNLLAYGNADVGRECNESESQKQPEFYLGSISVKNSYGDPNTISDVSENIKTQLPTVTEFANFS